MAQPARIPIPLKQHLLRFRLSVLPAIAFVFCVGITLWLWQRQATVGSIVGEVEAYSIVVPAGGNGLLMGPSQDVYWQRYDEVQKGDVLARLDDRPALARLQTVQLQAQKLNADLAAVRTKWELEQQSFVQEATQQKARLVWEVERRRIRALEVRSQKNALETELAGMTSSLKMLEAYDERRPGFVNRVQLMDRQAERAVLEEKLSESKQLYREVVNQYNAAKAESEANGNVTIPEVEALLAPIRADIAVQDAVMEEVRLEIANLVITAPIAGIISEIHRIPGVRVGPGDDIVTVAKPDSKYVVSYVREKQRLPVYQGMRVGLRLRGDAAAQQYDSMVETVGPTIQPVPLHQLADINTPERGIQILIPLPAALRQQQLRPGQLVQVVFEAPNRQTR